MKKLKDKMLYLGLNPKIEFLVILVVNLVLILASVITFIFLKELVYFVTCLGSCCRAARRR